MVCVSGLRVSWDNAWGQKRLEVRKMLVNRAESRLSVLSLSKGRLRAVLGGQQIASGLWLINPCLSSDTLSYTIAACNQHAAISQQGGCCKQSR